MNELTFYWALLAAFALAALVVFPILFFVSAPYGRHEGKRVGPKVSSRVGWILMEAPAALAMPLLFAVSDRTSSVPAIVFLALWELHYLNRAFVYPLRTHGRPMPLVIAAGGALFNVVNGYLNGRWVFTFSEPYGLDWLADPRFVAGVAVFFAGFFINQQSDAILRRLRRPGETGYKIPYGGIYRWVSSPNYLGEILEWVGWAIATWSAGSLRSGASPTSARAPGRIINGTGAPSPTIPASGERWFRSSSERRRAGGRGAGRGSMSREG